MKLIVLLCAMALFAGTLFAQPVLTIRSASNAVELTFQGNVGTTNEVQWIESLGTTNWALLTNVVLSSNQFVTVVDSGVTNVSSRFYRIVLNGSSDDSEVLLSNLSNPDGDGEEDQSINGGNSSTLIRVAVGFTLGSSNQSGHFEFTIRANNPGALNELALQLVEDNGGAPTGASIALASPAPSTTIAGGGLGYTLSWDGTLVADTVYWLMASVESPLVSHSYVWVDRGPYVANGANFFQAQAEAFGGWNEIEGVNLSLSIRREP